MKTFAFFLLLFPLTALAEIEFRNVRTSDGEVIQTCIRYPDAKKFHGPRPALMFIQGSGNEDSCLRLERPYGTGVIERGVAIFSRQKRGISVDPESLTIKFDKNKFLKNTLTSLQADAIIAFEDLQSNPRVDPKRIAVAGGSEGTILATAIAEKHPEIRELSLISSMIESFDRLYTRQLGILIPFETMHAFDADKSGTLSTRELTASTLREAGLLRFEDIDMNHDGQIDEKELASEFHRALAYSLATGDESFPMSDFGGHISVEWLRSAFGASPLGPRVLKLTVPTTLHHGRADINTLIEPVYELQRQSISENKSNFKFTYYDGLTHELTKDIIYNILFDLADNLVR